MDIILIPGLWLDAASWDQVAPHLEESGHRVRAITWPGMESLEADRSSVTRADCVDAVVTAVDEAEGPVVVVGHSMGADLAHAAVDARPDRVTRAIYIGGFPSGDGATASFPSENGEIPLFDWDDFEEADLRDMDEDDLARFRERAIPSPAAITTDPQRLTDERRYQVPVTVVCPEFTAADLKGWIADGMEPVQELGRIEDVTFVDLPTGHWPQFTKPRELAGLILDAARET